MVQNKPHGSKFWCQMSRFDTLPVSYATWLARRPGPRTEADFHPIIRRLNFECLMDIKKLVSDESARFDEVFPMLDPVLIRLYLNC